MIIGIEVTYVLLIYLKKMAGKIIRLLYTLSYRWIPVNPKLVIFISFHGRGYTDNPRAIYEAMLQDEAFNDYEFIWFIKNHKKKNITLPKGQVKEYFSFPYFFYLSKAKYWVVNCKLPLYIKKKKNQVYLQTWHGTPLKRLGHDIIAKDDLTFYRSKMSFEEMCHSYDQDVARYNYMISPNTFSTHVFQSAFHIDPKKIIETGYPRNDFMNHVTDHDIAFIKERYHLPQSKKIILYAPTWRDNSYVTSGYTFQLEAHFHLWKEVLGDDYLVLFKPHYLISNHFTIDETLNDFVYSIDANVEINELYVIADLLVTDYSSVFFDYAMLGRPIYFYMYDLKEYQGELRGFYLDIHQDLPGAIYTQEDKLLEAVKNNTFDYEKLKDFNVRFNNHQDGQCAKKVIDLVFPRKKTWPSS